MVRRLPVIIWALLCLGLATWMVRSASSLLRNIPWQMVGLVALTTVVVALIVWLLWSPARRGYASRVMQSGWFWWPVVILLLIATGIGTYWRVAGEDGSQGGERTEQKKLPSDTIFTVEVRPGKPVEVVMPPGWWLEWQEDESKFSSHAIWRGPDKIRVFVTKAGVESVEIKIRRYYQPARR